MSQVRDPNPQTGEAGYEQAVPPKTRNPVVNTNRVAILSTGLLFGGLLFGALQLFSGSKETSVEKPLPDVARLPVIPGDGRSYADLTRSPADPQPSADPVPPSKLEKLLPLPAPTVAGSQLTAAEMEAEAARKAGIKYQVTRQSRSAPAPTGVVAQDGMRRMLFPQDAETVAAAASAQLEALAQEQERGGADRSTGSLRTTPLSSNEANMRFALSGSPQPGDDGWSKQRLQSPKSRYEIKAGTILNAALKTALHSDLPGDVVAQITVDVRDSVQGYYLLLPAGTTMMGRTNSAIGNGQDRLQVVWTRLILPNGKEVALDSLAGADRTGAAGLNDRVDYHLENAGIGAILSTLLAVGGNLARGSQQVDRYSLRQSVGDSIAESASGAGQRIVERQLNIPPTITVREGFPVTAIVTRTMVLEPYAQ